MLLLGLFCTIRDDNGNPAAPYIEEEEENDTIDDTITPSIVITPDSAYVKPGDTLGIRVTVFKKNSGETPATPLRAFPVTARCNHGNLIHDSLSTDSDGRARFLFTSESTGNIEFTVESRTVTQTIRFEVTETPVRVENQLTALPAASIIKADGVDTTTISVQVVNSFRNPVVGECVQFISSSGTIVGENTQCANSGQSVTGPDGIARAILTSSNINDTAYITAYLASDQSLSDETEVVFQGMSIVISSSAGKLKRGDTAIITAAVLNASDRPVAKTPVFFTCEKGDNSNLSIISADSLTNYEGIATIRIRAVEEGSDVLSVIAAGTRSTVRLNVSSLSLTLDLDKTILQTLSNDTVHITATFKNASGSPLSGRTIKLNRSFKTEDNADTTDTITRSTGSNGSLTYSFTSLSWECSMQLNFTGYDNSSGGYASADTTLQFITTRVMTIRPPQPIAADGVSKAPVTVYIKNKSGNPIVGDFISFTTNAGIITARSETDEDGKAEAFLISDRRNVNATVIATLVSDPTKQQTTTVQFKGVELTSYVHPPSIRSNGQDTAEVVITLLDAAQIPICGERFNISKQQGTTAIRVLDSITDNNGEARCKISGTGTGQDTMRFSAAGASASAIINFSSNILRIDTAAAQECIADSTDSTRIIVTYLKGDNKTVIPNAEVEIAATVGKMDTIFARSFTTDANGRVSFYLRNPHFAVTATIFGIAHGSSEVTTGDFKLYFRANLVTRIDLSGSPEVITTNGGRAKLDAIAYDSNGNLVKDARISFNLVNGPSGGEYLDPPVSITGDDGKATTYLVSGKTPSYHRQVWITAASFSSVKSDTVKFTIAGPPYYITIAHNILKGKNPNDGTFILPCAAIVTDVNGNPVADGTEVTFSLKISGCYVYKKYPKWTEIPSEDGPSCNLEILIDSTFLLPFEDFNDNYRLDPGEDRNHDGVANRGEDINGDGKFILSPPFEDLNLDGVRQYDLSDPAEPVYVCGTVPKYADYNNNSQWDPIEPLKNQEYLDAYNYLRNNNRWDVDSPTAEDIAAFATINRLDSLYAIEDSLAGGFDVDANSNGSLDPNTAASIVRTVKTKGGKATNEILYGQSDAGRIQVMVWAESQGVVTETPAQLMLPIISDEE